jgi:hypothetical protein
MMAFLSEALLASMVHISVQRLSVVLKSDLKAMRSMVFDILDK